MSHTSNVNNLYPKPTTTAAGVVVAGQSLAVAGAAVQFGTAFNTNTALVFFDVQTADVIVTFDGSTPLLGTRGTRLPVGTNYTWSPATASAAKFLQAVGAGFLYLTEFSV
jgi:hypothetical protein